MESTVAKVTVAVGQIFQLPLDDTFALATVLWVSTYYKNLIRINVKIEGHSDLLIYTGSQKIKNGDWKIVGQEHTSYEAPIHISGGALFKGDEVNNRIRMATEEDYKNFPQISAAGFIAVVNEIKKAMKS